MVGNLKLYRAAVLRIVLDVPTRLSGKTPNLSGTTSVHWRTCIEQHRAACRAGRGTIYEVFDAISSRVDPSYKTTDNNGDERVDQSIMRRSRVNCGSRACSFSDPASKDRRHSTRIGGKNPLEFPRKPSFFGVRECIRMPRNNAQEIAMSDWFRSFQNS